MQALATQKKRMPVINRLFLFEDTGINSIPFQALTLFLCFKRNKTIGEFDQAAVCGG
jgi:hypothetical protein